MTWTCPGSTSSFGAYCRKTLFEQSRGKHILFTHFPKDPTCEVCRRTKVTRASCRRYLDWWLEGPEKWRFDCKRPQGSQWRARVENASQKCSGCARLDNAMDAKLPMQTISTRERQSSLRTFLHAEGNPRHTYQDNSLESLRRAEPERWKTHSAKIRNKWHCRSNCTTSERRNFVSTGSVWTSREMVDRSHGVSLLSSKCAKFSSRRQDTLWTSVQFTFWRAIIPCGAEVEVDSKSSTYQGPVHQFSTKVLHGKIMGYALNAGRSWTGDLLIVDAEDLQPMPPSKVT